MAFVRETAKPVLSKLSVTARGRDFANKRNAQMAGQTGWDRTVPLLPVTETKTTTVKIPQEVRLCK